jgi:hypothetical protein
MIMKRLFIVIILYSDIEDCSRFAEQYDNGEKVKPFEFKIKEK